MEEVSFGEALSATDMPLGHTCEQRGFLHSERQGGGGGRLSERQREVGRGRLAPGCPTLLLHGRGWPVGAGVVELDLRIGGAARQGRPFLIWQPPPPHLPPPDQSDEPLSAPCYLLNQRSEAHGWPSGSAQQSPWK